MPHCDLHGNQPNIHVSPDVAKSVYDKSYDVHMRRIDIYVDGERCFGFFLSKNYCERVGLPASGTELRHFTDDKTFEAELTWNPSVLPCCGKCFYDRYPSLLSTSTSSNPDGMNNGYVISDV